jgi:ABC-type multidrug transport system ATPase subunit
MVGPHPFVGVCVRPRTARCQRHRHVERDERQRLRLATQVGDKGGVYVLDGPTTGLHLAAYVGA